MRKKTDGKTTGRVVFKAALIAARLARIPPDLRSSALVVDISTEVEGWVDRFETGENRPHFDKMTPAA